MAPFSEEDKDRLDYRLLRDGPIILYFRMEILAEDVAWFARHSYSVIQFDCARWEDEELSTTTSLIAFDSPSTTGETWTH